MQPKEYFIDRPDQIEKDEYWGLYNDLQTHLDEELFSSLPNISFIMLKPNAYLAGKIPAIIDTLSQEGVHFFRQKLIKFTEHELDQLYMFVKKKYSDSWWIMKRLYSLAPCYPAIVIGDKKDYPHLSARIRDLVGPTTPIVGNIDNIRYIYRSPHRIFNTIHATDDPASTVRESLVFFGINDIIDALKASSIGTQMLFPETSTHLLPEKTIELNINMTKCRIKTALLKRIITLINESDSLYCSTLTKLCIRLEGLLNEEMSILIQRLPLQNEFLAIDRIMTFEKIGLSTFKSETTKILQGLYRNQQIAETSLQKTAESIAKCVDLVFLLEPLMDDIKLMTMPSMEIYLSNLGANGIELDLFTEVLFLGCWSGSYNELLDISLRWPL